MVGKGIVFVDAHDRLRRLRHVLRRMHRARRRLEVVVRRIHGTHLLQMRRLVHHVGALVQLKLLAQLELGVGGYVLLRLVLMVVLLLGRRASVLIHEHGGGPASLVVGVAIRSRRGHGQIGRAVGRRR